MTMTTREMVNLKTQNGTKGYVQMRFSGWSHDVNEVVKIVREMGYTLQSAPTFRHHEVINIIK